VEWERDLLVLGRILTYGRSTEDVDGDLCSHQRTLSKWGGTIGQICSFSGGKLVARATVHVSWRWVVWMD
jgi:hypothetical protein